MNAPKQPKHNRPVGFAVTPEGEVVLKVRLDASKNKIEPILIRPKAIDVVASGKSHTAIYTEGKVFFSRLNLTEILRHTEHDLFEIRSGMAVKRSMITNLYSSLVHEHNYYIHSDLYPDVYPYLCVSANKHGEVLEVLGEKKSDSFSRKRLAPMEFRLFPTDRVKF